MNLKKEIKIGTVTIGGNHPIAIQSMTNTKTRDIESTVRQINELAKIGADIVRMTISNIDDALAISKIKERTSIPLVADIHFDYRLAIDAVNQGIDKIRINPGNIGSHENVKAVVEACKKRNVPIRIGINSGSLEKDLYQKYGGVTPEALLESMKRHVELIESYDYHNLVLSIKATDINTTIKTNQLLNQYFDYPIHIGLTEAGTINSGIVRSSYTLGTLLNDGIGNTIRVSLTGDPLNEIPVAKNILAMFTLYQKPTLISCPTCGRTNYNMELVVNEIEKFLETVNKPIKVAIMGCAVNGPGEAKDADIGIAGGNGEALLFKKGEIIRKIPENDLVSELIKEIKSML